MISHNKGRMLRGHLFIAVMLPLLVLAMAFMPIQQLISMVAGRAYAMVMIKVYAKIYYIVLAFLNAHYHYYAWLTRDLADCESILELGCGDYSPLLAIKYGYKTDSIDIWQPYIDKHNKAGDYRHCCQADILKYEFPTKAYDAVVIFDVLEHLPREKVQRMDLFSKMEQCAIKKVIFFTPNGFVENDESDGDSYQAHLSAWEPSDYKKRGYKVNGGTGLRYLFGKASLPKNPQTLFYILGMLTQPLIYHVPELAWHSYAVKDV